MALCPLSKSRPAWAALPVTVMRKSPTPLRAVLRAPPGPAGSHTRAAAHFARQLLGEHTRAVAAGFFVRNQPDCDRPRQRAANFAQRSQGEHHLRDATFHVEHTRSAKMSALFAPGHCLQCAEVVHRVVMAEQQDRLTAAWCRKINLQMIARFDLAMDFHLSAHRAELLREICAERIAGWFVTAWEIRVPPTRGPVRSFRADGRSANARRSCSIQTRDCTGLVFAHR